MKSRGGYSHNLQFLSKAHFLWCRFFPIFFVIFFFHLVFFFGSTPHFSFSLSLPQSLFLFYASLSMNKKGIYKRHVHINIQYSLIWDTNWREIKENTAELIPDFENDGKYQCMMKNTSCTACISVFSTSIYEYAVPNVTYSPKCIWGHTWLFTFSGGQIDWKSTQTKTKQKHRNKL